MVAPLLTVLRLAVLTCGCSSGVHAWSLHGGKKQPKPKPPQYPASFEVAYTFSLPYESKVQEDGVRYPVRVWRDAHLKATRTDTYNGTNTVVQTQDATYEVSPRIDRLACVSSSSRSGSTSTDGGLIAATLFAPVLPDVAGWKYRGSAKLSEADVNVWELVQRHADGAKVAHYTFFATPGGSPVRLHQLGKDLLSGSHFDEYQLDYTSFRPGRPPPHVFGVPKPCKGVESSTERSPQGALIRAAMLLPRLPSPVPEAAGPAALYDAFLARFRLAARPHPLGGPHGARAAAFSRNLAMVEAWNARPGRSHSLGLNRFADWTQEEIRAALLPRKGRRPGDRASLHASAELPYERRVPRGRIPSAVDWRGTGAMGIVKDQATCGSCWAFGATGALQGAFFMATGRVARFSEQQLMDCSWEHGNNACDGGNFDTALDYLVAAGGAAFESDYEYLGADGFCSAIEGNGSSPDGLKPKLVPFKGYAMVPPYDDEALMEAVYARGPVAVYIDAAHPSFSFYASGVYDEPECRWRPEDMDHAVLCIGYGTEGGKDYWLIKNSWSPHWGDEGVIKVARARNGCGITSSPMYAVFEQQEGGVADPPSTVATATA